MQIKKTHLSAGFVLLLVCAVFGGYYGYSSFASQPAGIPQGYVYAVDSYGGIDDAGAQVLKDNGVSVYVQALSGLPVFTGAPVQPATRDTSLRSAQSVDLGLAGYAILACDRSGAESVDYARAGLPDDLWTGLIFVAVDVEAPCNTVQQVNSALDELDRLGKPRVVYTNLNTWVYQLGNPPMNAELWNASWHSDPSISYAGNIGNVMVSNLFGEQFSGNYNLSGLSVDRDVFNAATLLKMSGMEITPMPATATPTPVSTPVITPPGCDCEPAPTFTPTDLFDACEPSWDGVHLSQAHIWLNAGTPYFDDGQSKWLQTPGCK